LSGIGLDNSASGRQCYGGSSCARLDCSPPRFAGGILAGTQVRERRTATGSNDFKGSSRPMATANVIDLDQLLAPIQGGTPAGDDIRADFTPQSPYFALKDAQARARAEERKRREAYEDQPETGFRVDEWAPVTELCEEILAGKSKDLEVAAWYLESLLRQQGFAGVRDGLRLMRELVERYWDGLYPRPDEDGLATTVRPIATLNGEEGPGTLIWPITNIPITTAQPWGAWQYRQAQSLDGAGAQDKEQRVAEGGVTLEMFDAAVKNTPVDFFVNLLDDLEQCRKELKGLTELLDERCGVDDSGYPIAPSTTAIDEALAEALKTVKSATAGLVLEREAPAETTPVPRSQT
jgi:type VI secretion system protein ImpA